MFERSCRALATSQVRMPLVVASRETVLVCKKCSQTGIYCALAGPDLCPVPFTQTPEPACTRVAPKVLRERLAEIIATRSKTANQNPAGLVWFFSSFLIGRWQTWLDG
jgi:hypothetical protein